MKLVAAKCPNCGAQIEVDQNSDSTKCEYCDSKIIVEDAIEKYKVEISGSVQVNNLPTIENFIKLGDRHFNNNEFTEAYNNYTKAVELDPDNVHAVFRQGLCKAKSSNYERFELDYVIIALKNIYEILKNRNENNEIERYVVECNAEIRRHDLLLVSKYNQSTLQQNEVEAFNQNIKKCIDGYEYLYSITENNIELKKKIIDNIMKSIGNYLVKKRYISNIRTNTGGYLVKYYSLSSQVMNEYNSKKQFYYTELIKLSSPEEQEKLLNKQKKSSNNFGAPTLKFFKVSCFIIVAFACLMAGISLISGNFICWFLWAFVAVLYVPTNKKKILDKYGEKFPTLQTTIYVFRVIIPFIAFYLLVILSSKD